MILQGIKVVEQAHGLFALDCFLGMLRATAKLAL